MRTLLACCCLALTLVSCASAPPTLSPQAQTDFKKTQVIKVLDLLRDAAIDANAQTPPLLSTQATRRVVEVHKAALLTIQGADVGWINAVGIAVAQLSHDPSLLPAEVQRFTPYFAVVASVLQQVQTS